MWSTPPAPTHAFRPIHPLAGKNRADTPEHAEGVGRGRRLMGNPKSEEPNPNFRISDFEFGIFGEEMFRFPEEVCGWLTDAEGRKLAELAADKRVLEIGSCEGRSTICMAQVA